MNLFSFLIVMLALGQGLLPPARAWREGVWWAM